MGDTDKSSAWSARGARPRRILVVESAYQRRIFAAQLLAELGFRVILAADAEEAASLIVRQGAPIDSVLLSDGLSGRPLIEAAAAEHRPDLSIVELTGEGYSADVIGKLLGGPRQP